MLALARAGSTGVKVMGPAVESLSPAMDSCCMRGCSLSLQGRDTGSHKGSLWLPTHRLHLCLLRDWVVDGMKGGLLCSLPRDSELWVGGASEQ